MNHVKKILLTTLIFTLSACKQTDSTAINTLEKNITTTNNEVAELKSSIEILKNENAKLLLTIQELTNGMVKNSDLTKIYSRLIALEQHESVVLDPTGQKSFQRLDTNNGTFLVLLENVSPYLDGQKVTLKIGNPSAATYAGFKLNVRWGMKYPTYDANNYDEWLKQYNVAHASSKEKEINLTDTLQPGSWNKVTFNLGPAPTKEFGRLSLEMSTDIVQLKVGK